MRDNSGRGARRAGRKSGPRGARRLSHCAREARGQVGGGDNHKKWALCESASVWRAIPRKTKMKESKTARKALEWLYVPSLWHHTLHNGGTHLR